MIDILIYSQSTYVIGSHTKTGQFKTEKTRETINKGQIQQTHFSETEELWGEHQNTHTKHQQSGEI